MIKPHILLVMFCFLILGTTASGANSISATAGDRHIDHLLKGEHVPGEVLVKFRYDVAVNRAELERASVHAHSITGAVLKRRFRQVQGLELVRVKGKGKLRQALASYINNPDVEYAEPNYLVSAATVPDDPSFGNLWGLHNTGQSGGTADADIDAPEAWDITTGSGEVVIAVIDSGIAFNHPDLNANIWTNTGETSCSDGVDNDGNGYIDDCYGWDFVGDDNDPTDYHGHGTYVSGTIAAVGNNTTGVTGVMWQAQIMPLRILGVSEWGDTADAIAAIEYADENGAHVINNSWGGGDFSQALKDAIDASSAVIVCAAGNDGSDNDISPFYPASYTSSNILSVTATDNNDNLASFSNYGAVSVDLAAPGQSIYSSVVQLTDGSPVTVYSEDFDGGSGALPVLGWDRGGTKSTWEVTTGTGRNGTNSLEDSPNEDYQNATNSWAGYMTPFSSVKDSRYTLSFNWKGNLQNEQDFLYINYSTDGSIWQWIDERTGTEVDFTPYATTEITIAADLLDNFYIGFGLDSNFFGRRDGVYIDDLLLQRRMVSISSYSYGYNGGTSMATPHVSGVAGLIKAHNPSLTNLEIIDLILENVDVKASLSGKVASGGRLNAYEAVSVACPNLPVKIVGTSSQFATLQQAYNAAGTGDTILAQAITFNETLEVNLNKTVTMVGGYDCFFSDNNSFSYVVGNIDISSGNMTLGKFILY